LKRSKNGTELQNQNRHLVVVCKWRYQQVFLKNKIFNILK